MFTIADKLTSGGNNKLHTERQTIASVLFYQTQDCCKSVLQAFRFEGTVEPALAVISDKSIKKYIRATDVEIVIIELNRSNNITEEAERIKHLLPNHISVIVIGSEDTITTIRNLEAMGFYYLLWPATQQEFSDLFSRVSINRQHKKGLGKDRKAKLISMVGSKGGVGASLLTAEVAYQLSADRNARCLVVDHNYHNGNMDIFMGIKTTEKRNIKQASLAFSLDSVSAQSLVNKHSNELSVLALTSDDLDATALLEYTEEVMALVSSGYNFVLKDLSASTDFSPAESSYIKNSDCIVIVVAPTLSSLRDAARIKAAISASERPSAQRVMVVLNAIVPEKYATVTPEEVVKFLKQPIDVTVAFAPGMSTSIVAGKRISDTTLKSARGLKQLTAKILGEVLQEKPRFTLFNRSGHGQ